MPYARLEDKEKHMLRQKHWEILYKRDTYCFYKKLHCFKMINELPEIFIT